MASLSGAANFNGRIRGYNRPNKGGSFGAFDYAFQTLKSEYDLWCFLEDDVILTHPGLFAEAAEILKNPGVGFVSLAPIASIPKKHSGGGCGFTTTANLIRVAAGGALPLAAANNYGSFEGAEVEFTGIYAKHKLDLVNFPDYSPLCSNYTTHDSQVRYANAENTKLPHIYKVGLK